MSKDKTKENVDIADKSLAQQGALNVEDAENSYRDMNTLLEQASGVALANFIETGDASYLAALDTINAQSKALKENFIDLYSNVNQKRKETE
ncbi:hypothetical protein ABS858_01005 [Vibrio neptunius]|uniref:hypothetical protein n=1 Tax=Vibrio neptunius TaxID=170651 RepID=UPI00331570D9